jgi:hypothetical protein
VLSIICCQSSVRPRSTRVSSKASQTPCSAHRRLVHVPPRTTHAQHIKHTVEELPIVLCRSCPTAALRRQQFADDRPFVVRQIAPHPPVSAKTSLESQLPSLRKPFCQQNLAQPPSPSSIRLLIPSTMASWTTARTTSRAPTILATNKCRGSLTRSSATRLRLWRR